jgi:Metallopeptidase family M24
MRRSPAGSDDDGGSRSGTIRRSAGNEEARSNSDRADEGEIGTAYRIPCETSHASQPRSLNTTSAGYQVNTAFGGHGVGRVIHGPPDVPNDGVAGRGLTLRPGLVIAIEPWFLAGSPKIVIDRDGWTIRSVDGSRGVHVEHTVAVTAALAGMTTVTFLLVFDHRLRHAPRCHAVRIGDRGLLPGRRRHRRSTPRYRRPRKDRPQMTDASAVPCPPGRRCAGTESRLQHAHAGDGRQIGPSGLGCSLM